MKNGTKAFNDSIARKAGDIVALYVLLSTRWRMLNTASVCAFGVYLRYIPDQRLMGQSFESKSGVVDKKTSEEDEEVARL